MKKWFSVLFFSILFSFFCWTPSYATTIRISAPKVELELAAGEVYSGEIIAENPEDTPADTKLYLEDWEYVPNGTGEKKFLPEGSTPFSASKWIAFTPASEKIQPYGRITARYTITVPPDAKGAYYSVLFFETLLGSSKDEEGVNVLVAGRIGALFFIQIKGKVNREGDIKSVDVKAPEGNKPMEINTVFRNTGNVNVELGGNFLILDAEGKVQGRGDISKIYTFPGTESSRVTQWIGKLSPGTYQILLTYDLGKGKSLVEEKTLIIK